MKTNLSLPTECVPDAPLDTEHQFCAYAVKKAWKIFTNDTCLPQNVNLVRSKVHARQSFLCELVLRFPCLKKQYRDWAPAVKLPYLVSQAYGHIIGEVLR